MNMIGVVLWSDTTDRKAVIWCEDHGDLAFYTKSQDSAAQDFSMDAGDLVQFDLTVDRHLRFAHNPRLVADGLYPDLADSLSDFQGAPPARTGSAEIVPFKPRGSELAGPMLEHLAEDSGYCPPASANR
jgi:hypothetical protein